MLQDQSSSTNASLIGGAMNPNQQQQPQQPTNVNYNALQQTQPNSHHQMQHPMQQQQPSNSNKIRKKVFVKITEQPASKSLRFRYECEGRSAGSIPGINSTPENKTYPTIEIVGYKGRAVVVVSCVTKDYPYRPHPHNLVGKEGCKKGVCTLEINSDTMRAVFSNLGIQCVKKKDIEAALKAREEIRVDPFKTGFAHRYQPSSIDLNSVRLCFQVFLEGEKGRFTQPLTSVVSDPIFDKKAMSDLVICRLCSCSASVLGNTQILLFCEKIAKEDISVRFFEEKNGEVVWEAFGDFQYTDVHKQTGIAFKTPRYHTIDITEPVKVFIQLRRPSDGVTSEPLPFEYTPLDSDPGHLRRKRQKLGSDSMQMLQQQQKKQQQINDHQDGRQGNALLWNSPNIPLIKTEPSDTPTQQFPLYRPQAELTQSPQPVSPMNNYNSTPPPFNMIPATTNQNSNQLLSPSHLQYNNGNCGISPVINHNVANITQMDANNYHFGHGQHQQPTHQQPPNLNQQQFHENVFGNAGTNNNLTNTHPYAMQQLINNEATATGSPSNMPVNHQWNLMPNAMQMEQNPQQPQHHQHYPIQISPGTNHDDGVQNAMTANNNNENGPTVSNLLNFDSEQLVHINTEDQQMIRLNSEDLQISNLSISS